MSTENALRRLISENVVVETKQDQGGKRCCVLKEENAKYLYSMEITDLPSDAFIIKCDGFPVTDKFFKGDNGECRRADYIIISNSRSVIMIIEMKTSNKSATRNHTIDQLKGARCIVEYIKSIGCHFLNDNDFLHETNFTYKYYWYQSKVQKRDPKKDNKEKNNTPEEPRKISGKSIYFNRLLV